MAGLSLEVKHLAVYDMEFNRRLLERLAEGLRDVPSAFAAMTEAARQCTVGMNELRAYLDYALDADSDIGATLAVEEFHGVTHVA